MSAAAATASDQRAQAVAKRAHGSSDVGVTKKRKTENRGVSLNLVEAVAQNSSLFRIPNPVFEVLILSGLSFKEKIRLSVTCRATRDKTLFFWQRVWNAQRIYYPLGGPISGYDFLNCSRMAFQISSGEVFRKQPQQASFRQETTAFHVVQTHALFTVYAKPSSSTIFASPTQLLGLIPPLELEGHTDAITCLTSGKTNYFASGSSDNTVRVWNYRTWEPFRTFTGHQSQVTSLCFDAKESLLFSGSREGQVKVWNLKDNSLTATFPVATAPINALVYHDRTQEVFAASSDRTVRIWDLVQKKEKAKFRGHETPVVALASLNEDSVCSGGGMLRRWNPTNLEVLDQYSPFTTREQTQLGNASRFAIKQIAVQGATVAVLAGDGRIAILQATPSLDTKLGVLKYAEAMIVRSLQLLGNQLFVATPTSLEVHTFSPSSQLLKPPSKK